MKLTWPEESEQKKRRAGGEVRRTHVVSASKAMLRLGAGGMTQVREAGDQGG